MKRKQQTGERYEKKEVIDDFTLYSGYLDMQPVAVTMLITVTAGRTVRLPPMTARRKAKQLKTEVLQMAAALQAAVPLLKMRTGNTVI